MTCVGCSALIGPYPGFGRPRKWCDECREARKREGYDYDRYHQWYVKNRDEVLARYRAKTGRPTRDYDCRECGRSVRGFVSDLCDTCRRRQRRQAQSGVLPLTVPRPCRHCGTPFVPGQRNQQLYCAPDCTTKRNRSRRIGIPKRLRLKILKRDEYRCYLQRWTGCVGTIPEWLPWHHPLGPTVDHVIPESAGGKATPDNLRAAHWACNRWKAARLLEDAA